MDKSFRFWNLLAKRYAKTPLADESAYLEKLRIIREHLNNRSNVLEFGCGTGSTALLLSPHAGSYLALDYSARMIEIAREKAEREHIPNLRFECADFGAYAVSGSDCDVVIGMNILHLLKDWESAIDRVYASLAPGGVFFSSTACLADMDTPARHLSRLGGLMGLLPVLSIFSEEQLNTALTGAGFRIFHRWQPGEQKPLFIAAARPN